MAMPVVPMAQTRNRPPLRNNNTSSYRYAYEHGYRAGYEDGFAQGQDDFKANERRDFARSDAYRSADRTYESGMGALNEYKDAYRIGFEVAYNDGYYGRPYSTSMPTNLGQIVSGAETAATRPRSRDEVQTNSSRGDVYVPDGVELKVRLTSPISTKTNREGDTFTVTVLDPSEYADATITGHIAKINRSGKASGKTEMALAFDAITLRDRRNGSFAGQVERVYASESVKTVDEEGNVETASRGKDTAVRGVGGGALGAIIGGIAGGGKGAAIGAIIGAGVGAGSVFVQGGKDLMLDPGTEMLIRSNGRGRSR
jgi:outer membrane lipoprotein SlyB